MREWRGGRGEEGGERREGREKEGGRRERAGRIHGAANSQFQYFILAAAGHPLTIWTPVDSIHLHHCRPTVNTSKN